MHNDWRAIAERELGVGFLPFVDKQVEEGVYALDNDNRVEYSDKIETVLLCITKHLKKKYDANKVGGKYFIFSYHLLLCIISYPCRCCIPANAMKDAEGKSLGHQFGPANALTILPGRLTKNKCVTISASSF
jgi:hypothetical protein